MDIFAGSELRLFISSHLENESTGQLIQEAEEPMDTTSPNLERGEQTEATASDEIEVIEITLTSPEHTGAEMERQPEVAVKLELEVPDTLLYPEILRRGGFSGNNSTGSDESSGHIWRGNLRSSKKRLSTILPQSLLPRINRAKANHSRFIQLVVQQLLRAQTFLTK